MRLRRRFWILRAQGACLALIFPCAPAARAHYNVHVNSSNAAVIPSAVPTLTGGAPRPASYGEASMIVNDDDFTTLDFDTTVYNIDVTGSQTPDPNDNLIGAGVHIGPGITSTTSGPRMWGFMGAQDDDTALPLDLLIQPFPGGVGGAIYARWDLPEGHGTTLRAQIPGLLTGHAYIQYDTVQFPNGEIRGMIPASTLHGDANLDGVVDINDLYILAQHWQDNDGIWTSGDFDGNGIVNSADLGLLATNWQAGVLAEALTSLGLPQASVPDPGLSLGFSIVLATRRPRRPQARMTNDQIPMTKI